MASEKISSAIDGLQERVMVTPAEALAAFGLPADENDPREDGFKDGMHSADLIFDEVLQAIRVDLENADLDPVANTAAKMTIEAIGRLWYERKEGV